MSEGLIFAYRYLFGAFPLTPVVVVAVQGGGNDWAAYIAGLQTYSEPQPDFLQRVYREGCKLSESEAIAFFPHVNPDLSYRR
ncbi:MAG: hypothetical protein A3E01_15205 [Gammaproteobacteria bacterium RIFCSPHIGHO2_12_FULL_63_22]|nr:MAG: hypothetical protein A3E01_15205 [Gammaproteobacteria bacterium RIFCSPHIGHO2_12_FULL_63_22]